MTSHGRCDWRGTGGRCLLWRCLVVCVGLSDGFHTAVMGCFRPTEPAAKSRLTHEHGRVVHMMKAAPDSAGGDSSDMGESSWPEDEDGRDFMSQLMGEVNQREQLRRKEGVRLLKRPSALLPPHAVLEHVLGSLRTPDYPVDDVGLQQAFLFTALDGEVSRGPIDYRRDWSDDDEAQPRYLDKESCAAVIRKNLGFLVGMSDFSVSGAPIFSEDDHRVTFPVRVVPDEHTSTLRWVDVDFRLGRVREGSHKDCWLVERAIVRARGGMPDVPGL